MRSKQEAAAARAAAAQRDDARSRLSGLEVERKGYVARGDDEGAALVDEEISRYSELAGFDTETPTVDPSAVDLSGLEPAEIFRMFGIPDDVVDAFAADAVAKAAGPADMGTADNDQNAVDPADADKPAEPTGRRGRARTAAKAADEAAADPATAPAGD